MALVDWLLDPSGLTPHGFCLSWAPGLIGLHAGSDAVVALSYFSIPLALAWFLRDRRDLRYRWMVHGFVAFILACGATHVFSVLTLWVPAYGAEGLVKFATALLSVATAVMLWPLVPRLLALPSPEHLSRLNAELSARIAEQERTETLLRDSEARGRAANADLERRVAERTADLRATNETLAATLAERDAALQAVGRSEAEFRASFDAAPIGTAVAEYGTRRIVKANRALADILGCAPEDLLGRDTAEVIYPEDRPKNIEGYARLLAGAFPAFVRETRCMRRDGTEVWTRISTSIARDARTGEPTQTVALVEHIDAQYRAEAELRAMNATLAATLAERDGALRAVARSEAQFRAGFESAAVGMVLTDPESRRIVQANRAFATMLGYEADELIGRDGREVVLQEDLTPVVDARARLLAGDSAAFAREARCLRRDGTTLWTRISISFARDPQTDQPVLAVSLIEDIDARYQAEAKLRALNATLTETLAERDRALLALARSEAQFRAGFADAAVGIAFSEPETRRIVQVNRAFAGMLGYAPEELVGGRAGDLVAPEDRGPLLEVRWRVAAGEQLCYTREARLLRRDGTPLWTRISQSAACDPQTGKPALMVAIVEDIDARYRAEAELRVATQNLERTLEERTAALAQRDLLLREVYHRVKNNLQIVDSLLAMQARQLADPEAKRALLGLRGRIYALGLVHQQLMGSANLKTFDVAPFLRELSRNIVDGGGHRGVELSVDACPLDVGLDYAVPLGLVVTELVTNSLKHAFPDGTGHLSVRLQPDGNGEVLLVVADDGRAAFPDTTAGRAGTGLGLNIVKGLVAQLEGRMAVRHEGGTRTEIRTAMPVQP
jgi:PAS domain S-box-containing protein